jgi:hypothetical protein
MITQDYICRNDDKVNYSKFNEGDKIDDATPCMDNAYIFPSPDYQDMGNGFIKCTVTAYGRVNASGCVDIGRRIGDYVSTTAFVQEIGNTGTFNSGTSDLISQKLFDVATYRFSAKSGEVIGTSGSAVKLLIYGLNGKKLPEGITSKDNGAGSTTTEEYKLGSVPERYEIISYGFFSEVIISVAATGSYNKYSLFSATPS